MGPRIATEADVVDWAVLRARLWPELSAEGHAEEIAAMLARPREECANFVVEDGGALHGFAEAALRHDYVNGCETSPVAYLEGIYVRPEDRGRGIGGRLLLAVRGWARTLGCRELASDADLENTVSQAFHAATGFEETERAVFFRMRL